MKKFVSGVIVGVLLFAGASVFADSAGLIGQKVQGLFAVEKNGAKVADAVVINGTAYAPVRAVADAAGTSLKVEGKKIIMSGTEAAVTAPGTTTPSTGVDLEAKRASLIDEISKLEKSVDYLSNTAIPSYESMAKEMATNGDLGKRAQQSADTYKEQLAQNRAKLESLRAELAEINAQLAGK